MKPREFPKLVNGMLEYKFDKPLYGTMCRIRAEFLEMAIELGLKMKIVIPGVGSGVIDPVKCYRTGNRTVKVFRDPDNPMRLIDVNVPINAEIKVVKSKDSLPKQLKLL